MRSFAVLIAFALLLLAAAAVFAPATLLDARLDTATQGQLRLADTAGTVWNGRGLVTNAQHTWSLPLSWKVDLLSLVRGDMAIMLQAAEGGDLPRGEVAWRDATLALDGVALTLPATALNGTRADSNTMAVGGYIAFDAPHVIWSGNGGDGAATARWSGARVAGNAGTLALGTVAVNFAPRNGRIQGHVENRGGDVGIDGEFAWGNAGVEISATLAPLPSTPPSVVRALGALGPRDANGAVRVQWRSGTR
jgi:peptidoglycan/LPS O-acetylase OafA/YrhL